MTSLAFDTTALSHFARSGRMDELRMAVADDEAVLLAEVAAELVQGIQGYPSLGSAASGGWLKQVELEELPELAAFARYKGELGGGPERNNGEAAVLGSCLGRVAHHVVDGLNQPSVRLMIVEPALWDRAAVR